MVFLSSPPTNSARMRLQFGLSSTSGRLCYRTRTQYGATSFLSGDSDHCKYHRDAAAARLASAKRCLQNTISGLSFYPWSCRLVRAWFCRKTSLIVEVEAPFSQLLRRSLKAFFENPALVNVRDINLICGASSALEKKRLAT